MFSLCVRHAHVQASGSSATCWRCAAALTSPRSQYHFAMHHHLTCPPLLYDSTTVRLFPGFGLLGHLLEVCRGSRLTARVSASAVPLMAAAPGLAQAGVLPGAVARNWESYGHSVRLGPGVQVGEGRCQDHRALSVVRLKVCWGCWWSQCSDRCAEKLPRRMAWRGAGALLGAVARS